MSKSKENNPARCGDISTNPPLSSGPLPGERHGGLLPAPSPVPETSSGMTRIERELRAERNFVNAILDTTGALIAALDPQGRFLRGNRACEELMGIPFPNLIGQVFWEFSATVGESENLRRAFHDTLTAPGPREIVSAWRDHAGATRHVLWCLNCLSDPDGEPAYVIASGLDITEAVRLRQERELLISQLQDALARIKTLRGLIPICAGCKKIRDDRGYWHQVERYITEHSEAEFSHGMCPECIKRYYPEFYERVMEATAKPAGQSSGSVSESPSVSDSQARLGSDSESGPVSR